MNGWLVFLFGSALLLAGVYPLFAGPWLRGVPLARICVKSVGTLLAAALAAYGAARMPEPAAWWMVWGLLVCAAADAVISLCPAAGGAMFLAAHVCYLRAFLLLAPFPPQALLPFALFFGGLLAVLGGKALRGERQATGFLVYGAVLLLTLSVALFLPARIGPRGAAAAAGMLLFAVSDGLIAAQIFPQNRIRRDCIIMGLYYAAQLLLALAALQPWRLV